MPCPAVPEDIPKCLVFLFDLYLAKLPHFAVMKDILYLWPKLTTPLSDEKPIMFLLEKYTGEHG